MLWTPSTKVTMFPLCLVPICAPTRNASILSNGGAATVSNSGPHSIGTQIAKKIAALRRSSEPFGDVQKRYAESWHRVNQLRLDTGSATAARMMQAKTISRRLMRFPSSARTAKQQADAQAPQTMTLTLNVLKTA